MVEILHSTVCKQFASHFMGARNNYYQCEVSCHVLEKYVNANCKSVNQREDGMDLGREFEKECIRETDLNFIL